MMKFLNLWVLLIIGATGISCHSQTRSTINDGINSSISLFPYDFASAKVINLPTELDEISGITFLLPESNSLYAIQDEEAAIFDFDLVSNSIVSTNIFGKPGDFEDITTDGQFYYVLKSNGHIHSVDINNKGKVIVNKDLVPNGEYESLSYDLKSKQLVLLCKDCKVDKKHNVITGYIFDIKKDGKLSLSRDFIVEVDKSIEKNNILKKGFKASAIAKKNSSNEWYIISSIQQKLLIADHDFHVKEIVSLPKNMFEQPEGLGFDAVENLYISSEKGTVDAAKLFIINKSK